MKTKIEDLLKKELPNFSIEVFNYSIIGCEWLGIIIGIPTKTNLDAVSKNAQEISLRLDINSLVLGVQIFGGRGGNSLVVKPKEKHRYCSHEKISFRTPQKNEAKILEAIKKFAQRYKAALIEHRENLMYSEITDNYSILN